MKKEQVGGVALFGDQKIRRVLVEGDWWFSVVDVCGVLSGSDRPKKYWSDLKKKIEIEVVSQPSDFSGRFKLDNNEPATNYHGLKDEGDFQLSTICRQLK